MSLNRAMAIGNLGGDLELRYLPSGQPAAWFLDRNRRRNASARFGHFAATLDVNTSHVDSTAGRSDRAYKRLVTSITIRTMSIIPPIPIPPAGP